MIRNPDRMEVLISNDDGIEAPGLRALFEACDALGADVRPTVVAPEECHSAGGHRVTTERMLAVREHAPGWIGVDGTPADCVRVALHGLRHRPDWVLSGINAGGNLGADVYLSGTVAAVREATIHGVRGIAFSHYLGRGLRFDWERATRWTRRVLGVLKDETLQPGEFWNVNLPSLPGGAEEPPLVFCDHLGSSLHVAYEAVEGGFVYAGNYHARVRDPGSDVEACFSGAIAISRVRL
jgi:5'-nucleotidase